jgi:GAF domain-containing protein
MRCLAVDDGQGMAQSVSTTVDTGLGDRLPRLVAAFDALDSAATHDPLPRFLHVAAIQLAAVADGDCSCLSRLHENALFDSVTYDPRNNLVGDAAYLVADYPTTRTVLATRTPAAAHVDDPGSDPSEVRLLREFGLSSVLLLPIVSGGYTWGLAEAYREGPKHIRPEHVAFARLFVAHLGSLLIQF